MVELERTGASRSSRTSRATLVWTLTNAFSSLDSKRALRNSISRSCDKLPASFKELISFESAKMGKGWKILLNLSYSNKFRGAEWTNLDPNRHRWVSAFQLLTFKAQFGRKFAATLLLKSTTKYKTITFIKKKHFLE